MLTSGPRGTKDILPDSVRVWQYVESVARDICQVYGYKELRTPIFEHTELFLRGIGETTDIVEKEMYTFTDRGGRSITLRPENTAAAVRAYLEHKLYSGIQPVKLYYIGPMFRYDRPQAGRFRQFHQFGIEAIGAAGPQIDAEIILLAVSFLRKLGLSELRLLLNSVGCPNCRPLYRDKLQGFLKSKLGEFCSDCQSRFDRNPMRMLDCKNTGCQSLSQGAPHMSDCLCAECREHFNGVQQLLNAAGISYDLDPRLVRGLDYYTKTAFEIQYSPLGAQSAVCGGGRYDGLVAECGGEPTPGIGFAIGLERVLLALEKQQLIAAHDDNPDIFIVSMGESAQLQAFKLLMQLREAGFICEMDHMQRSLKSQLKLANKLQVRYVGIIGEEEAAVQRVMLKNMQSGEQELIDYNEVQHKL